MRAAVLLHTDPRSLRRLKRKKKVTSSNGASCNGLAGRAARVFETFSETRRNKERLFNGYFNKDYTRACFPTRETLLGLEYKEGPFVRSNFPTRAQPYVHRRYFFRSSGEKRENFNRNFTTSTAEVVRDISRR